MASDTATATTDPPRRSTPGETAPAPATAVPAKARPRLKLPLLPPGLKLPPLPKFPPWLKQQLNRRLPPWLKQPLKQRVPPWLPRPWRRLSPLTRRILAVNVLALALLGAGFLYLGQYRESLIAANLDSLKTQAEVFAAALGEEVVINPRGRIEGIDERLTQEMMRRLVEPTRIRARLFNQRGDLIADTRFLRGPGGAVEIAELAAPSPSLFERVADAVYGLIVDYVPGRTAYPPYVEPETNTIDSYPEAQKALAGDIGRSVRSTRGGRGLILTVAAPVQHYRQVLGAVQLSMGGAEIDKAVRSVRFEIIRVFIFAFAVTVLLSIYLAGTIARPIRRLAAAAHAVRRRPAQATSAAIPDLTRRGDEIGELSGALREMTDALWQRIGAIERFAADVAHELKNPLTSLRSAIETVLRLDDPARQRQLLALVLEDIIRLDRLITDISDASRLDAELTRDELASVPVGRLLAALVEVQAAASQPRAPRIALDLPGPPGTRGGDLPVLGVEGRLVQVFRNLIANAVSFSPPGGEIRISAAHAGGFVTVTVEDEGPGIPTGKEAAIFERFYSERPAGEKFGIHSGLGLSISKQIVESHKGRIWAENRRDAAGGIAGARFWVRLPAA